MNTYKIIISLFPDTQDFRDILIAMLSEIGFEGFVEDEKNVEAYIPEDIFSENLLSENQFEPLFSFSFTSEFIEERNWNEVWEKNYFKPLLIGGRCVVRASFHKEYPKAEYEIVIDPNMAFGTGNHETTSMMVEYILDSELTGKTVLDMGCGTGILAMLAFKRGARKVLAVDIDQRSVDNTIENCSLNDCSSIKTEKGDASVLEAETYDLIFANIQKNILMNDVEKYSTVLNTGGFLFMSGFYKADLNDIIARAKLFGIKFISNKEKNKWVAACFIKDQGE
ncbi:MAG: 50S ribosomal protein L11 methyltransferase [Prolixibacteraceae bacterium]|nr:50S ribosomal protein L11 methyltransferase [Prolixibacteraceae bacterium]